MPTSTRKAFRSFQSFSHLHLHVVIWSFVMWSFVMWSFGHLVICHLSLVIWSFGHWSNLGRQQGPNLGRQRGPNLGRQQGPNLGRQQRPNQREIQWEATGTKSRGSWPRSTAEEPIA